MSASWKTTLVDILDGLRAQPGRLGLSFFAIAVGMVALTVLISVLGGLKERSRLIIEEIGANVLIIVPDRDSEEGLEDRVRLKPSHIKYLADNLPSCAVAGIQQYDVPTLGEDKTIKVIASDAQLQRVRQWPMVSGRFIDAEDVRHRGRNAVITLALSRQWNWRVGDNIHLREVPFQVVGIVDSGGNVVDTEVEDKRHVIGERVVFIPSSITPHWKGRARWVKPEPRRDAVYIRLIGEGSIQRVARITRRLLEHPDYHAAGLSWITPETLLRGVRKLQRTIKFTVGSIAVLCLVLGGTTLMSLMVANVRDRVTEIGLRRALGATPADIATLFVMEACLITAMAACLGSLGTFLLLTLGRAFSPVPLQLGVSSILIPIAVAVFLGMVFSYVPAKIAAGITPSQALRND